MAERPACELRYKAFLSYSHKDAAAAGRLHRRLESYRMPRRLVGRRTALGPVPQRLWPIFRDREEMAAASDLSETVRAALAESAALVVLCSPNAAGSLWVSEEIATFRRLYPDRPVLAAILAGDPPACFPAALRAQDPDGTWHEPLATDLRREGDGPHLGLLKLVAGITGVALDDLVQRDAARRLRRVTAVTAGALIAVLIMAALTVFALDARREAERQRAEAEGLIEFMLTDLRERLRGVGRLDVLTSVNERALAYYGGQRDLADLSPGSLDRRARILHAIGEDHETQQNLPAALAAFQEAHRTTTEQLRRSPNDPTRIYAHSQSEFWVGHIAYNRRDFVAARRSFERYRALAERLVTINPSNAEWLKELAFAEGTLCTISMQRPRNLAAALHRCAVALERMEVAARASGDLADYRSDLANRHADLSDALWAAGRHREALQHRHRQLAYVERQLIGDPRNAGLQARRIWACRAIALLEAALGRRGAAKTRLEGAIRDLSELVRHDPQNEDWAGELSEMRRELGRLQLPTGG